MTALELAAAPSALSPRQPAMHVLLEEASLGSEHLRGAPMPYELGRRYGGPLLIPLHNDRPTLVANFVSTLDGIVAFGNGDLSGGGLVSGFHEPDRFVMALLRAIADVVVVGAGTLRGADSHRWTPEHVQPAAADLLAAWRTSMGLAPRPTTVFVTASGNLPLHHPALAEPTSPVAVATTARGADRLAAAGLPQDVRVEVVGSGLELTGTDLIQLTDELGARLVLTEGGPHLLGVFLQADLLDELFLTLSPQMAGRGTAERLGLVEGLALPPGDGQWQELVSVRRSIDHLFLRYRRRDRRPTHKWES
jgi:riboflavin biosynthesis pyrimidine reductase